ncbi:rRNA biogenesis protein rrp5 [Fusarium oxysporum f. sp. albedinis]|nr:rRNA biogenesis protein rrp5 [Fusarium oxysporum f. sp. albedinis]
MVHIITQIHGYLFAGKLSYLLEWHQRVLKEFPSPRYRQPRSLLPPCDLVLIIVRPYTHSFPDIHDHY